MKKLLGLVFIPLFIIEFIFAIIVIITTSIVCNYNYPYNDFLKIEKNMSLSKNKKMLFILWLIWQPVLMLHQFYKVTRN